MSNRYKIIGYGVCGKNEKYIKGTLDKFKELCDHVVIVCNNTDARTKHLIESYGFEIREDDREWGYQQNVIKEDLVKTLGAYNPDWLVCMDMDEVLDIDRETFEKQADQCDSMYVYIVNMWNEGWKRQWSFWNIRAWKWNGITKFVNRPLHCGLAPEWAYHYGSYVPTILWHYGLKDKEVRERKVNRYLKYDPNAVYRDRSYYTGLMDNTCDELDVQFIKDSIAKEVGTIKRKNIQPVKKKVFYMVEKDGRQFDIPEAQLQETLKRGFKLIGKI